MQVEYRLNTGGTSQKHAPGEGFTSYIPAPKTTQTQTNTKLYYITATSYDTAYTHYTYIQHRVQRNYNKYIIINDIHVH